MDLDGSWWIIFILYQIFKIILRDKPGENTDNPSLMIYINKMENRITFKRKAEYYLELLSPETMKLLRSNKSKIIKMQMAKMCLI